MDYTIRLKKKIQKRITQSVSEKKNQKRISQSVSKKKINKYRNGLHNPFQKKKIQKRITQSVSKKKNETDYTIRFKKKKIRNGLHNPFLKKKMKRIKHSVSEKKKITPQPFLSNAHHSSTQPTFPGLTKINKNLHIKTYL